MDEQLKKTMIKQQRENWDAFLDEFSYESDRASVVLGAAFLDNLLGDLIRKFLVDDNKAVDALLSPNKPYAPLSSFAARISVAYCLGLIDRIQHEDLTIIRQIRNLFAHGLHGLSFESNQVTKKVAKLKTHRMMTAAKDTRSMFFLSVAIISTDIEIYAREMTNRCSIPSYYDFIDDSQ